MSKHLKKRKAKLEQRRNSHAGVKAEKGYRKPGSMNGRK